MNKKYLGVVTAGLLALATLTGISAAAQGGPKGKVSASLLSLTQTGARNQGPQASKASSPFEATSDIQVYGGYVVIEAVATTANARKLLADLQARGLRNGVAYGALVSGLFPVDKLATLEKLPSLQLMRPAYKPALNVGRTTSQGDRALRADVARTKYGLTGNGVKVGILSDSYNNLGGAAAGVASDDLPPNVQVLADLPSGGLDEGRGMAEIVHDVAPRSTIAFHTAFLGQADFAQGIEDLQSAGCKVIVDDIIYFAEPFFQDGIIAQAANNVVRRGSAYFSSAGNQAQQSYETSFNNSGSQIPGIPGVAHNFAGGDVQQLDLQQSVTIGPRRRLSLALQWDDPFFSASGLRGAKTDLDLYILFNGQPIFSSTDNNIGGDPFEFISIVNNGNAAATVEVVIVKIAGPDPSRIKYINYGNQPLALEYDTQSSTLTGHANAERAVAVAAAPYFRTPLFNANTPIPVVESFSSLGGTPILFSPDGRRLRKPRLQEKPEITGPDGVNTTFFPPFPGADFEGDGFPNFFGTSAAAPHVAAVAALLVEATQGAIAPLAITKALEKSAIDMDNPLTPEFDRGFDFKTGFGFVQADAALMRVLDDNPMPPGDALVSMYPNPASNQVTFRATAPDHQLIKLTVLDRMGREVFHGEGLEQLTITKNISGLPKGLYVAKVQTGTKVKTQILVLE